MSTSRILCLLCVALCISGFVLQFSHGVSVRCESEGVTSSCHLSKSCQLDNPISQEQDQCHRDSAPVNESFLYDGFNVTECPRSGLFYDRCHAAVEHTDESKIYFLLHNVSHALYSLDPEHFSMNVSWAYAPYDFGKATTQSIHPLKGYELRIRHDGNVIKCLCIWEPHLSDVSLSFNPMLVYKPSSPGIDIRVSTLPYNSQNPSEFFEESTISTWPASCNSELLVPSSTFCPEPLHNSPRHVRAEAVHLSPTSKELHVSWSHPSVLPHPKYYYIYISDGYENFTILANMTRNITITDLNSTQNYSVQVQGYSHCSGLSSYISGSGEGIGCGMISDSVPETVRPTSSFAPTVNSPSAPPTNTHTTIHYLSFALPLILSVILFITTSILVLYCINKYTKKKPGFPYILLLKPSIDSNFDVLVLYSPDTPLQEQIFIQRYVVGRVQSEKFSVQSCNDHIEKTVAQWVEEQVKLAHSIFIICNQSFYKEWNNQKRSPLLNSLETIISYAASHKDIDKYATVLLEESDRHFIPDNLYLKAMKSFVIGEDVKSENMEEIVRFIKLNCSQTV